MIHSSLLIIKGLEIGITTPKKGELVAVKGLDLDLKKGESLCLVGESGCGKTLTALSILGLLPNPPIRIRNGSILFEGNDLVQMSPKRLCHIRGRRIAMIFQEPMTALNPVFTIGEQIAEAILIHKKMGRERVKERVIELLEQVGVPEPKERYSAFPHQLSGGLRQRAMIAMALSCDPDILIADEPTTALDVTIQGQILELLEKLRIKRGLSLFLITHNLAVVAQVAQRVAIMYAGRLVEQAPVEAIFKRPLHPYTKGLLASIPYGLSGKTRRLKSIPGNVPPLDKIPSGCVFHNRCRQTMDICKLNEPALEAVEDDHKVACFLCHRVTQTVDSY